MLSRYQKRLTLVLCFASIRYAGSYGIFAGCMSRQSHTPNQGVAITTRYSGATDCRIASQTFSTNFNNSFLGSSKLRWYICRKASCKIGIIHWFWSGWNAVRRRNILVIKKKRRGNNFFFKHKIDIFLHIIIIIIIKHKKSEHAQYPANYIMAVSLYEFIQQMTYILLLYHPHVHDILCLIHSSIW